MEDEGYLHKYASLTFDIPTHSDDLRFMLVP